MRHTKIFIQVFTIATAVFISPVLANAQSQDRQEMTPQERAELQTEIQTEKLGLSEEQQKQMYDLNLKYANEMENLKGAGRSYSTFKKMKKLSKEKDQEVEGLLSSTQYEEYLTLKEEFRQRMRERRGSR